MRLKTRYRQHSHAIRRLCESGTTLPRSPRQRRRWSSFLPKKLILISFQIRRNNGRFALEAPSVVPSFLTICSYKQRRSAVMLMRLYRRPSGQKHSFEECFYVELQRALAPNELDLLKWLISDPLDNISVEPGLKDAEVVEIGPRLSVETPFSSSAVAICQSMGLPVRRIEKSSRYQPGTWPDIDLDTDEIIQHILDPMTQEVYGSSLTTFDSGLKPEPVRTVPVLEQDEKALREANTN